ncbi:DNA translocase FtsK 4TM domain-containing protein [Psychrobacter sp. CAM01]|uniref:DNA translocase FtsK 4TM domain-containing protein n=1 Tax=Psychrobacter sp. CAM01 TaxID=3080335 RepID=UPI0029361444|nr:DNA translocase FtsK 4TM domain-containing protein [Psychrobacter sp. CAM01]MDV2860720.1 DNA translocase FtsK 4TM domain-containing protein [Psychrobacter sp. CAM01]
MISAPLIEYLKKGIFTLLGLILTVYLFVILMTYTGNDPSWSHISSDMTTINNMGGKTGAWLSDLLYRFFGFGAWWLLAFMVYESILIWWDNKPTFWLMRLVAYVFLLLSASALFAQLVALVQQVADPVATELEGVAGGIIGLELQARLAQLLSQWGSVVFLTVFVTITTTFAFNIHWLSIYQKITALAWLGSGVKNKEAAAADDQASKQYSAAGHSDDQQAAASEHEQLALELPTADATDGAQSVDKSGRFGNVLSEFLTTSGLADSVKASVAAATQAAKATTSSDSVASPVMPTQSSAEPQRPVTAAKSGAVSASNAAAATATPVMTRKVEPSFAWNDASTVDDLLASEQAHYHADDSFVSDDSYVADTTDDISETASTVSASYDNSDETLDNEATSVAQAIENPTTDMVTDDVDTLAEAWLAEHAETLTPATAAVDDIVHDVSMPDATAPSSASVESLTADRPAAEEREEREANVSHSSVVETVEPSFSSASTTQASAVEPTSSEVATFTADTADMTPTNTPPANPKQAPTVEALTPETSTKPAVSFAVPEGDSSNHITDMMPDDDAETVTAVMPDISDDAAFSKKSRSMQTAAYRNSLTPIPEMSILDKPDPDRKPSYTTAELEQLSELLEIKLQEFNVKASVVNAIPGPVVTRFEVELAPGVKASKVTGISRDLARSLSMASLRVVEVIPGKPYIGIEVPNKKREMVRLIELLNTETYKDPKAQISMAMGKDIGGNPIITDLARAPHMLVAGTTGSGKSVLVNSMLLSMLLKYTPNELRLILIDPKQLELANYNDIPHLLTPVVTDMTEAASSLSWCVAEMERRYQLMSLLKVRKLGEFNKKVAAAEKAGKPIIDPLWRPNDSVSLDQAPKLKTLPMIVIVADEFADMIMQVGKQAEELITRLAQKSRAAGIHLMLATQRPSVDVITGLIKANIPVRAALRVNSKVDSRTILDSGGAEDMLGNGDMLFLGPGQIEPDRVHGAYVSDEEVNRVCDAWRERGAPDYIDNMAGNFELSSPGGGSTGNASGEDDDLYDEAVAFIMETRKVSASSIQRKFSIGYNRAARIVDSMEEAGLVSSMGKSGKRELLM